MGATSSSAAPQPQQAAGMQAFTPSDGFFLIDAARAGNTEVLRLFLQKNPALAWAVASHDKATPWHTAAERGHSEALQLLAAIFQQAALSNTFNPTVKAVNQQDIKGRTPLMLACRGGHHKCTELLLELGADVSMLDDNGYTAFHQAALAPHGRCTRLLLKHAGFWGDEGPQPPADPTKLMLLDQGDPMYGFTPLHLAAWSGQVESVVGMLAAGAGINIPTTADCFESFLPCNSGTTALHMAAMKGHEKISVMIMAAYVKSAKRGGTVADPRKVLDAYGNTPFRIACTRNLQTPKIMLELLNPQLAIKELRRLSQANEQQAVSRLSSRQTPRVSAADLAETEAGADGAQAVENGQVGEVSAQGGGVNGQEGEEAGPAGAQAAQGHGVGAVGVEQAGEKQGGTGGGGGEAAVNVQGAQEQGGTAAGAAEAGGEEGSATQHEAPAGAQAASGSAAGREVAGEEEAEGAGEEEGGSSTSEGVGDDSTCSDSQDSSGEDDCMSAYSWSGADVSTYGSISIKKTRHIESLYDAARRALLSDTVPDVAMTSPPVEEMQSRLGAAGAGQAGVVAGQGSGGGGAGELGRSLSVRPSQEPPPSLRHTELSETPVPDFLLCPLTCRIFDDPVVAADGYSYERAAMLKYLESNKAQVSPSTRKKLSSVELYPNHVLRNIISDWKATHTCPDV